MRIGSLLWKRYAIARLQRHQKKHYAEKVDLSTTGIWTFREGSFKFVLRVNIVVKSAWPRLVIRAKHLRLRQIDRGATANKNELTTRKSLTSFSVLVYVSVSNFNTRISRPPRFLSNDFGTLLIVAPQSNVLDQQHRRAEVLLFIFLWPSWL